MDKITICALYKFIKIKNLKKHKNVIYEFLVNNNIMGTILIAEEGINGTISGNHKVICEFLIFLEENMKFGNIDYKLSYNSSNPFYRTKVRIKKEIVTLGIDEINSTKIKGTYIEPEKWNDLIEQKDTIIIDTRNEYEIGIGTFKNALNPHTDSFREFPKFVNSNLKNLRNKKIAMFCTGGIRCEKSTAFLKKKGFKDVYHLKGGILNYLKKIPKKDSLWNGECFVFDNRVSVNHDLKKGEYDQCHACRMPITEKDKESDYYNKGISCHHCYNLTSGTQKKRFMERQKQIEIAKKHGIEHIGKKYN